MGPVQNGQIACPQLIEGFNPYAKPPLSGAEGFKSFAGKRRFKVQGKFADLALNF